MKPERTSEPDDVKRDKERLESRKDIIRRASFALFERSVTAKAFVTADGYFVAANEQFQKLLGFSEFELTRMKWQDLTHPADLEADLENVRRTIAGQMESYEMHKRYLRKPGEIINVLLRVDAIRGEHREFICLLTQAVLVGGNAQPLGSLSGAEVRAVRILAWLRTNWHIVFFIFAGMLGLLGWVVEKVSGK